MTTTTIQATRTGSPARAAISGAIAGLGGGLVFGMMMAMMGMLPMVGMNQMVFVIGEPQWISLMGHIVFGVVTGLIFVPLSRRL